MKQITLPAFAAAVALALCPAAFAAKGDSGGHGGGETSGPAAGKPTTPNTVIPKQSGAASTTGAGFLARRGSQVLRPGAPQGEAEDTVDCLSPGWNASRCP